MFKRYVRTRIWTHFIIFLQRDNKENKNITKLVMNKFLPCESLSTENYRYIFTSSGTKMSRQDSGKHNNLQGVVSQKYY